MDNASFQGEELDFQKLFTELYEKAKQVNPALIGEINSFSDTQISIENYESYVATLNQTPMVTTSNSIIFQ